MLAEGDLAEETCSLSWIRHLLSYLGTQLHDKVQIDRMMLALNSDKKPLSCCRQGALESGVDVAVHGPIPQAQFLGGLGIEARLDALLERATTEEQTELITGFNRLIGGQEQAMLQPDPGEKPSQLQEVTSAASEETGIQDPSSAEARFDQGSQERSSERREEGMGLTYKVMAMTSVDTPPPVPFSYKSLGAHEKTDPWCLLWAECWVAKATLWTLTEEGLSSLAIYNFG